MMVMMTYPATWQLELRVTAPDLDPDAVIARCRDPRPDTRPRLSHHSTIIRVAKF